MHPQPASPKKPCRLTYTGRHQWFTLKRKRRCWICGAVALPARKETR